VNFAPDGLLLTQTGLPKFGVWIMPDNQTNGMLEYFIKFLIPDKDELLPIANDTLNQIEHKSLNKYKNLHRPKALIHTWLAWQEEPGSPMGSAITKRYLDTSSEICDKFVKWLSELFN
jgi:hypothetical protein